MRLGDKVEILHLEGEVTHICNHPQHPLAKCVEVTLTNNMKYTLKFIEGPDLEVIYLDDTEAEKVNKNAKDSNRYQQRSLG